MKIAVLALQGAFYEHETILQKLGADCMELRKKEDLSEPLWKQEAVERMT